MFHLNICSTTAPLFLPIPTHTQPDFGRVHHLAAADRHQAALSIYLPAYTPSSFFFFRKLRRVTDKLRSDTAGPPYHSHLITLIHPSLPS
jgi:hypothetical protein